MHFKLLPKKMPRRLWNLIIAGSAFAAVYFIFSFVLPNGKNITTKDAFVNRNTFKPGTTRLHRANSSLRLLRIDEVPKVKVKDINCAALFANDPFEQRKALKLFHMQMHAQEEWPSEEDFVKMTNSCKNFIRKRHYVMKPVSEEEYNFPLAFSMLIYKDFAQFERLFRAVYRPQNLYCIHVEQKSSVLFHAAAKGLAGCFENVFIAPVSISVEWGEYSVMEPELICMEELWKRSKKWKYFINLTGQEFPLKTIGDIVKILTVYNGANNMEGTILRQHSLLRSYVANAPHGIKVTKGSVHITACRGFVDYVLHNSTALEFREWIKGIPVPDELFFSSLNFNPQLGVPGSYKGIPETDTYNNRFITRFKNWGTWPFVWPCAGMWVRQICIFGVEDLPLLASRPELFANKFFSDYQPLALDCMEERYYNLTRDELLGNRKLDLDFYKNLDFVKNHV